MINPKRRKEIEKILISLENISQRINNLYQEETEVFENLPESVQDSEKGEHMLAALEALEIAKDALSSIDDIVESLRKALG